MVSNAMPASAAADTAGTRQDLTDGGCEPHNPRLYEHTELCTTSFSLEPSDELEAAYHRDGYVVLNASAFGKDIPSINDALTRLTSGRNEKFTRAVQQRVDAGVTPDFTAGCHIPWIQYEAGTCLTRNETDASLLLTPEVAHSARKLMGFVGYEPAIDAVVSNTSLLAIVARLLDCSESKTQVKLFQDMALLKPAGGGREKPWHQDKAYFNLGVASRVVGCWMAVDDVCALHAEPMSMAHACIFPDATINCATTTLGPCPW